LVICVLENKPGCSKDPESIEIVYVESMASKTNCELEQLKEMFPSLTEATIKATVKEEVTLDSSISSLILLAEGNCFQINVSSLHPFLAQYQFVRETLDSTYEKLQNIIINVISLRQPQSTTYGL